MILFWLILGVQEGLWEEAELLRRRELDMTASDPSGAPPRVPRVDVADIEAVVSTWTGIDVQRLGQDEQSRLLQLASVLEVGTGPRLSWQAHRVAEQPGASVRCAGYEAWHRCADRAGLQVGI